MNPRIRSRERIPDWMRVYYAMVANVDHNVGRMRAAIERLGIEKDTIFVFTSDHGELFGAHGRRAKNIFYEEAVRVPFLVRCPGTIPERSCDVCLNTVDVMPTLLTLCGLPIPAEAEGRDLSAALLGKPGAPEPDGALMMGTGATADWGEGFEWRAFRTKRYTYAVYLKDGEEHLYDNLADPLQMKNLAGEADSAPVLSELKDKMAAEMARVNDRFHPVGYYRENWVKDRIIKRTKAD